MSRYFSERYANLTPYVPGEQPRNMEFIKLNTNESPFPPSPRAVRAAGEAAKRLQLYSDPECRILNERIASLYGISSREVICFNGSDELLNFAMMAFCSPENPVAFANITYSFYNVIATLNNIPYVEIPLRDNFTINTDDYVGLNKTIIIANPNAPTGVALPVSEIEKIVKGNPDNVVIVDEAYVDFGGETSLPLIHKYSNVLIARTFSKSRSMAGARLGYGMADKSLIDDLNTLRNSFNPYNINSMTMAAGIAAIEDEEYTRECCRTVAQTRDAFTEKIREMGFILNDSSSNFVFARHDRIGGNDLYTKLRSKGFLVRYFGTPLLKDYIRISIGSASQMERLSATLKEIVEES